jgi:hypothetical protein
LQLRIVLKSEEFDALVRLDSLWIETAPLLASRVVGEVALVDDAQPAGGLTQVQLGARAEFAYDIRGEFAGVGAGFDAVRICTGTRAAFARLEMDGRAVAPVAVVEGEEDLSVVLPERIEPGGTEGARVVFAADVFALAWTFAGEVYDDGTDVLPQPIEPGDVSAALGTNGLRVLGMAADREGPVAQLAFSTGVLTPNGDGIHDEVEISYALVGFPEAVPVTLHVYALDGRRVAERDLGQQRFGAQSVRWNGRDGQGALLPPGRYVVEVVPVAERTGERLLRALAVVY